MEGRRVLAPPSPTHYELRQVSPHPAHPVPPRAAGASGLVRALPRDGSRTNPKSSCVVAASWAPPHRRGDEPGQTLGSPLQHTATLLSGTWGLASPLAQSRTCRELASRPQQGPLKNGSRGCAQRSSWPFKNNPRRGSKYSQAQDKPQILAGLGPRPGHTAFDTKRSLPGQTQSSAPSCALSKRL